jgi:ribosomal RNA assembly protein
MIDFVRIPEERMKLLKADPRIQKKLKDLCDCEFRYLEDIEIESDDSIKIFRTKEVVKAFGRGFNVDDALALLDESYYLEIVEIESKLKDRITVLKGRVIGREGGTKKIIEKISGAKISIYGKTISIIGRWDELQIAKEAIDLILSGSKHSTVYRFLKENQHG